MWVATRSPLEAPHPDIEYEVPPLWEAPDIPWPELSDWPPLPTFDFPWPPDPCDVPDIWWLIAERLMQLMYLIAYDRASLGLNPMYPWFDLRNCWMANEIITNLAVEWMMVAWDYSDGATFSINKRSFRQHSHAIKTGLSANAYIFTDINKAGKGRSLMAFLYHVGGDIGENYTAAKADTELTIANAAGTYWAKIYIVFCNWTDDADAGGTIDGTAYTFIENKWYLIDARIQDDDTVDIYVNGVFFKTKSLTGPASPPTNVAKWKHYTHCGVSTFADVGKEAYVTLFADGFVYTVPPLTLDDTDNRVLGANATVGATSHNEYGHSTTEYYPPPLVAADDAPAGPLPMFTLTSMDYQLLLSMMAWLSAVESIVYARYDM